MTVYTMCKALYTFSGPLSQLEYPSKPSLLSLCVKSLGMTPCLLAPHTGFHTYGST